MLGEMISNRKLRYGSLPDTHQEEAFATLNEARGLVKRSFTSVCAISFSGNQTRRGQQPFPPTQIIDVYGLDEMLELAVTALKGLREDVPNRRVVHLPDVQSFLREELIAAIELMYSEGMQSWWDRESTGEKCLVNLIRMRRTDQIDAMRDEFLRELAGGQDLEVSHVLAWCVYVDSILLNERLNDDIRETTGTRPSDFSHPCWMPFFGPDPSPEVRSLRSIALADSCVCPRPPNRPAEYRRCLFGHSSNAIGCRHGLLQREPRTLGCHGHDSQAATGSCDD
jgi:hypothetical protein